MWHFPVPLETFILSELRELVRTGHDVRVFCRYSPHKDFEPDFPIDYECVGSPEQLVARLTETRRTIVHAHFAYPTVTDFVWPACERAQLPFTFMPHAQDIFRYSNDEKNRIGEIGQSNWCVRVFALTHFHRDFLLERGVPAEKIMIKPNGIDAALFRGGWNQNRVKRERRAVCAVQRYVEKKGLDRLIKAGKLLEEENITINIFGYGDLEDEYRALIHDLKTTNVVIRGPVNDRTGLVAVFREHDLFACTAVRAIDGDMDGLPTVLLEAMAAGLPVFASPISGIPDLVSDGITGLICETTPGGIADCIRRYYAMPEAKVQDLIDAGLRRVVQDYDISRLTQKLLGVWQEATSTS